MRVPGEAVKMDERSLSFHRASVRGFDRSLLTRRSVALGLTIIVHLLMLLGLLLSRQPLPQKKVDDALPTTFTLAPEPEKDKAGDKAPQKVRNAKKTETKKPAEAAPPNPPQKKPVEEPVKGPPAFITLSREDFAGSDIGRIAPQTGGSNGSAGAGANSAQVAGPGEGPGGVRLYEAEWYRKPSDTELAGYMPPNAPRQGWGLVACKTIENFHVENCQTLGESPLGSGFGRAVRQAAWQFLVRPPRVNGAPQVGAWVRIRIDYSARPASEGP